MTIDLDVGADRDDLALMTPTKRMHTIAEILANGIRRRREDARRMGESGDISAPSDREEVGLESRDRSALIVRLVDALRTGESVCLMTPPERSWPLAD